MVGKKIRAYREFRGYSQIQLAELSGINVGTIKFCFPVGTWNPKSKTGSVRKDSNCTGIKCKCFSGF